MNHAVSATDDLEKLLSGMVMPGEVVNDDAAELEAVEEVIDEMIADSELDAELDAIDDAEVIEAAAESTVEVEPEAPEFVASPVDPLAELLASLPESGDAEVIEPTGETVEVEPAAEPVKAKGKAKREAKAPSEPKPKKERVFFGSDKVRRLRSTLGDKLGDFMVLTMDDAALDGDALKAKQDETIAIIDAMGVKVKNRATLLLEFAAGRTGKLNNVIATALKILAKDGSLVSGDKGNLFVTLLAKPYAPSAARAMGNNTLSMLRQLKLIEASADEKQTFHANPQSLLLAFVTEKMGLSFGELDEGDAIDEVVEIVTPAGSPEVELPSTEELVEEVA